MEGLLDGDVSHRPVGVDDEVGHDGTLYLLCFERLGVFQVARQPFHELYRSAGELRQVSDDAEFHFFLLRHLWWFGVFLFLLYSLHVVAQVGLYGLVLLYHLFGRRLVFHDFQFQRRLLLGLGCQLQFVVVLQERRQFLFIVEPRQQIRVVERVVGFDGQFESDKHTRQCHDESQQEAVQTGVVQICLQTLLLFHNKMDKVSLIYRNLVAKLPIKS